MFPKKKKEKLLLIGVADYVHGVMNTEYVTPFINNIFIIAQKPPDRLDLITLQIITSSER